MKSLPQRAAMLCGMALACLVAQADPIVSNVRLEQIAGTRQVKITYDLAAAAIITATLTVDDVAVPETSLAWLKGDVHRKVGAGVDREIIWLADTAGQQIDSNAARAIVTAWPPANPPPVMVLDLTEGRNASSYPLLYYPSLEALPGGVDNLMYKHSLLVLRRISMAEMEPYGKFAMGAEDSTKTKPVTLTRDYYIGIFPVTRGQWANVLSAPSVEFQEATTTYYRPVVSATYDRIRGASDGSQWPANGAVEGDSFMGLLRARSDLEGFVFDLPTDAQWEYACRAGTTTYYNDGLDAPDNTESNAQMDVLGRYKFNGGYGWDEDTQSHVSLDKNLDRANCGPELGLAIVGSYLPNAWGLYDMHGNVDELCLDWYASSTVPGGTDPKGPDSGSKRVTRGSNNSFAGTAALCRSAARSSREPNNGSNHIGLRLAAQIPVSEW